MNGKFVLSNLKGRLGTGYSITREEKPYIVDYVFQEIVQPLGGTKDQAEYLVTLSDITFFENPNPEQPLVVRITWYENYAPWQNHGLTEWFYFHKPSLELISQPIAKEMFWLPADDGKNAIRANEAMRNASSANKI